MSHPYDRIAEEPGGMECEECNVIFIGAEYHRICAVCAGINEPPRPVSRECDCCGEMKSETRAVYIPTVGDTVVCEDCSR